MFILFEYNGRMWRTSGTVDMAAPGGGAMPDGGIKPIDGLPVSQEEYKGVHAHFETVYCCNYDARMAMLELFTADEKLRQITLMPQYVRDLLNAELVKLHTHYYGCDRPWVGHEAETYKF